MEMGFPGTANGGGNNAQAAAPAAIREQDRLMPIANVIRIMRRVLPPHAKISDDAKETIQECVSEYISFITGEANERCQREQRKTITAEDVLWAMSRLGFDDYVEPLSVYLHRFREFEGEARGGLLSLGGARGDHHGHHHGMLKHRGAPASMVPPHHDMQMMHAGGAMYGGSAPPPTPHHHPFLMPPPHHGGQYAQYEMYGGEHGMAAAYYGGASYAPGNGDGSSGSGNGNGNGDVSTPPAAKYYEQQQPFGYK